MAASRPSSSPSPTRNRTFAGTLSALGAKLNRTFSGDTETLRADDSSDTYSIASTIDKSQAAADRSLSRGREVFSSGRGGAGNIRQSSASRTRPVDGPDDFSQSRGREPAPAQSPRSFSIGRGGAGNMRSPSRDVKGLATPDLIEEERVVRAHFAASQDAPQSSGRGGAGNITARSRSRDPASGGTTPLRSTGRGGAGNIIFGENNPGAFNEDEEERKNHHHREGLHSTGRGGAANISTLSEPPVEHHTHGHTLAESHGRGGAGNIVRDRSAQRD
jgi:hypothetical protein